MRAENFSNITSTPSPELLQPLPVNLTTGELTHLDQSKNPPDGPLLKSYRDGDSIWSITSAKEQEAVQRVLAHMIKDKHRFSRQLKDT